MKEIPLTKGYFAIVDDEDYEYLMQWKWCVSIYPSNKIYAYRKFAGKSVFMHRFILNAKPGMKTDHINGNTLDNRRMNLREVTSRQNMQNWHGKKTSRYPGVSWNKAKKRWFAHIFANSKSHKLGSFLTEEEAFMAYREAANRFGFTLLPEWQDLNVINGLSVPWNPEISENMRHRKRNNVNRRKKAVQ